MGKLVRMIAVNQEIQTETGVWIIESINDNGCVIVRINNNEVAMTEEEVLAKLFNRKDIAPNVTIFNPHQVGIVFFYPIENDFSMILLPSKAIAKSIWNTLNVHRQDDNVNLQEKLNGLLEQYPHEEYDGIAEEEIWEDNNRTGFAQYINDKLETWYAQVLNADDPIVIE